MATIPLQKCYPVSTVSGNSPETKYYPEGAGETFKQGELVYIPAGYVAECADDPSAILGIAAADASNTATDGKVDVPVWIANEDTFFCANVYHTSAPSGITAVTDVGTSYGVYRDTTNSKMYVDKSDTVATRCQIKWLDDRDAVGDTYGRVWIKFLLANRELL